MYAAYAQLRKATLSFKSFLAEITGIIPVIRICLVGICWNMKKPLWNNSNQML